MKRLIDPDELAEGVTVELRQMPRDGYGSHKYYTGVVEGVSKDKQHIRLSFNQRGLAVVSDRGMSVVSHLVLVADKLHPGIYLNQPTATLWQAQLVENSPKPAKTGLIYSKPAKTAVAGA
jgi:hypothetical protein